jgi:hypothetical protein
MNPDAINLPEGSALCTMISKSSETKTLSHYLVKFKKDAL